MEKNDIDKQSESVPSRIAPPHITSLPPSVVLYYAKYRNPSQTLKKKIIGDCFFEIDDNYKITDEIGTKFTKVFAAQDKNISKPEESFVCIKKIEKAFEHKVFAKRTLREFKIMRLLNHENILPIRTLFLPKSREEFNDIYLCTPLMETDLASIIKSPQSLTDEHIQFFTYQILCGLKYIHSAGIVHRDLKPRNLLANSNCDLKISEFGLARFLKAGSGHLTDYVVARWYRPPELLLETREYEPSVDIWSVGCILAELLKRKPFLPGTDTKSQLDLVFEIFGTPTEDYITAISKPRLRKFLRSLEPKEPKDLYAMFPTANPLAIDLLKGLMAIDLKDRLNVNQALAHPYFNDLHSPSDESTPIAGISTLEFEFEKYPLSLEQLKDLIYEEILMYHFPKFKENYLGKIEKGENPFEHVINNENAREELNNDSDS